MSDKLLPIQAGTLAAGACFDSEQSRLVAFAANMNAVLSGGQSFYNYGSTVPAPANRGYPWLRTTDMRWYEYGTGVWRSPVNYSTFERRLFEGSLVDLQTYDGGDTNAFSPTSGPMWTEDINYQGRSPMGPGAVPTSAPPKTLAVSEAYGEGAHALLVTELPALFNLTSNLAGHRTNLESGTPQWFCPGPSSTTPPTSDEILQFTNPGGGVAHQTVHPVRGIYVIRWSGRLYRTAS